MKQYIQLCKDILAKGQHKDDRTGTGTISYFGYQCRYNLEEGFPLLTTKKVFLRGIIVELLWFISGSHNIRPLVMQNVNIWNDWPFEIYKKSPDYQGEDIHQFALKIKEDEAFANKYGELGPVYGKQWRDFCGVDQLKKLEYDLKHNKNSRRLIISAWNPSELDKMALPPCHAFMQFYVSADNRLSCQLYQRSADVFLGVPFNIASYALFTLMLCNVCGYKPGDFIHTLGDAHIYTNHLNQINEQIQRELRPLPTLNILRHVDSITDFKLEDFELTNYNPHPAIKGAISV